MFGELIFFNNTKTKPNRFTELTNQQTEFFLVYENPMSEYYNYAIIAKMDKEIFPPIKNEKISITEKTSETSGIDGQYRFRIK